MRNIDIMCLSVSGTNLFAGTLQNGVYLSTNNGTSWNSVSLGLLNSHIYSIAAIGTRLFAGTGGDGVFQSTDNGTSWNAVNAEFPNSNVKALAINGTNLFAGTSNDGIFLSTNYGANWIDVNLGLTNKNVFALTISRTNILAGTYEGGIWKRPLSEVTAIKGLYRAGAVKEFSLKQNYPNPFNPETKIKYSLPIQSFVTLKIYNAMGEEIATLVNEEKAAGSYDINFNASRLASGIYFYKLQSGSLIETRKLCVLK
jgi:hypothetical protein